MKAEIKFNSDGELVIGYEGEDEFSYPKTFSDLKKCENVLIEKIDQYSCTALIDDKIYHVRREMIPNRWARGFYHFTVL